MYEEPNVWRAECLHVWMYELNVWMFECMNVWMCECLNVWMYEYMNVWMYEEQHFANEYEQAHMSNKYRHTNLNKRIWTSESEQTNLSKRIWTNESEHTNLNYEQTSMNNYEQANLSTQIWSTHSQRIWTNEPEPELCANGSEQMNEQYIANEPEQINTRNKYRHMNMNKWIWATPKTNRIKCIRTWAHESEYEYEHKSEREYVTHKSEQTNLTQHPLMAQPARTMIWGSHVRPHISVLHEALKDLWTPQAMQWHTSAGQVRRFSRIAHHGHGYHFAEVDWVRPQAIEKRTFTAHNESSLASELQTVLTSTHLFDQ